jgi:hypothetical protein
MNNFLPLVYVEVAIVQPCELLRPHARCPIAFETSEYISKVGTHMET